MTIRQINYSFRLLFHSQNSENYLDFVHSSYFGPSSSISSDNKPHFINLQQQQKQNLNGQYSDTATSSGYFLYLIVCGFHRFLASPSWQMLPASDSDFCRPSGKHWTLTPYTFTLFMNIYFFFWSFRRFFASINSCGHRRTVSLTLSLCCYCDGTLARMERENCVSSVQMWLNKSFLFSTFEWNCADDDLIARLPHYFTSVLEPPHTVHVKNECKYS